MGIRATTLVAFIPIFLVLALLSAVIEHTLVQRELLWGFREESNAVAVGIASFLDRNTPAQSDARDHERLAQINQILHQRNVRGIEIIDLASHQEIAQLRPGDDSSLKQGLPVHIDPYNSEHGMVVATISPIHDEHGVTTKAVKVILDASELETTMAELHNDLILRVVFVVALSLPIGWLFGWYVTKKISETESRADAILTDPTPHTPLQTRIKELNEVNEMIEILAALLEEKQRQSTEQDSSHGTKQRTYARDQDISATRHREAEL